MTQLAAVHHGLNQVRRFRSAMRLGSAWCLAVCILLWALLAEFGLDLWVRMGQLERGILLAAMIGLILWVFGRFIRPVLGVREDETSLALLVERNQGIHSDLVAALQFAEPGRGQSGSAALRQAVVDYVGELAPSLNFLEGFPARQLVWRIGLTAATLIVWLGLVLLAPHYVLAFANRFVVGSATYPTRTRIVQVIRPGLRAAYGQPVLFEVQAAGWLPETGVVQLRTRSGDATTTVTLHRSLDRPGQYTGRFERLLDQAQYTVQIGDASLGPRPLALIPLPSVTLNLQITTPAYARARFHQSSEVGSLRTALEGSRVVLIVKADKPLRWARLTLDGKVYPLTRAGDHFVLDRPDTPLAHVTDTLHGQVQVQDEDGLSLDRPLNLMLLVRPDNPPRIAAAAVTRVVMPDAVPSLRYQAVDDFGLAQLTLHMAITRAGDEQEAASPLATTQPSTSRPGDEITRTVARFDAHPLTAEGTLTIPLASLHLTKGDRVAVTLEATDWRGGLPGKSTRSETLVFEVTDRQGVLATMDELNDQMSHRLDEIIRAQLGIGGRP